MQRAYTELQDLARGDTAVRSPWRTALALSGGFIVVCFVAVIIEWIRRSGKPTDTATILATDLSALAIAITLLSSLGIWWRNGRLRTTIKESTPEQSSAAADRLAEESAVRWQAEAGRRRIITPAPATVRWRWAIGNFASRRSDVAESPLLGTGPAPLPKLEDPGELLGSGVVNRLHDEVYARLPHGRLVLLGEPGAGKTGAMILLLLAALARRASLTSDQRIRMPVPVWLTMGGWDPSSVTLQDWAVSTMNRDHPFLRASDYGLNSARELLRRGRVALFLDGLDEIPMGMRDQALHRISNEARSLRVVMTSRTEEYERVSESNWLENTAVVELRPIRPAAAAEYLLLDQAGARRQQWETLVSYMKSYPASVVARALDNPLTLSLAREVYTSGDPASLTLTESFGTVETIRVHLIDQTLVAAYPVLDRRVYVTDWLSWLSQHMGASRDLLWWRIPACIPRWQLVIATASCTALASSIWIWFWLGFNFPGGLIYAIGFGCSSGAITGFMSRKGVREPRALMIRKPNRRELGRIIRIETWLIIMCTLSAGLLAYPANELATGSMQWDLLSICILLIISAPLAWLPFSFLSLWSAPLANSQSVTPASTYHSDYRASIANGLAVGLAAGITPAMLILLFGGNRDSALILGASVFAVGSTTGLASGQVPMVWVAELVLTIRLRRRLHFINFAEDALAKQVLRQAGSVYQFRHSTLQDRLMRNNQPPGEIGLILGDQLHSERK